MNRVAIDKFYLAYKTILVLISLYFNKIYNGQVLAVSGTYGRDIVVFCVDCNFKVLIHVNCLFLDWIPCEIGQPTNALSNE